ncbi:hypothetical protein GCM10010954_17530 [Halobacillus andaensis]|uniref:Aminoglycoside phosphotransferase domain-containing protein n=1 Tax=Halobacillus andaensis TaxID=1176239 RepID=A0A917EXE6_HALAA|nr:phosphotransferase [Halobacillus andaensis]MBP2004744.1 Ser/Thr protein kinase RdoA (MazF antagonist) [Halobacillus andaensis]GGF19293.1 hypothetical protein GCM10010954_17530 [Halobacillus andaensis]
MEQWVERLFTKEVVEEAARRYNVEVKETLGSFENYVLEVNKNDESFILRLTHSSHRTQKEVEAELEFLTYLESNRIAVSSPKPSVKGNLVEDIQVEDSAFFACLFIKAPGQPVQVNPSEIRPQLIENWGQMTGSMHALAKSFTPTVRRKRWEEDDLLDFSYLIKEGKHSTILEEGQKLKQTIQALPESRDTFGLIHSDLHFGNFFVKADTIYPFDFDDSCYSYFAHDVAIPVYYTKWANPNASHSEMETLLTYFIKGYRKENTISKQTLEHVTLFLRLRDYTLYSVLHKKWDVTALTQKQKQILDPIRERLIDKRPIVEISPNNIWRHL